MEVDERPSPPARDLGTEPSPAPTVVLTGFVALGAALRVVWIARNGPSFDESFTAMAGRRSVGSLLDFLRSSDSHPPLDYLLRLPFARLGANAFLLRTPSLVFSVAALSLFAWWMRTRGIAGVVAVVVMALSPFQIMYGGEARMYALLELLGVAAAVVADGWLRAPKRAHEYLVAFVLLVAVFDHISGMMLALGLLAIAGVRRDRCARRWRIAIIAPLAVWALVWGSSFLAQARATHASWIDRTSPRAVVEALAGQVTTQHGVAFVVALLVVLGVGAVMFTDKILGRVVLACAVLPFAAAAVIGIFFPFFIDRTVTIAAWAPCVAIGFGVAAVQRRSHLIGLAAMLLIGALLVPASVVFLDRHWEYDASIGHVVTVAKPGDIVATVPDWYGPLIDWRVGVRTVGAVHPVRLDRLSDAHAIVVGRRATTGRAWVLWFAGSGRPDLGAARCAPDWSDGVIVVSCLRMSGTG